MTDFSKLVDLGGEDIAVRSLMMSTGAGQTRTHMITGNGQAPTLTGSTTLTMTAAMLATGLIVATGTTTAFTFDSAANIVAFLNANYSGANVGDIITCTVSAVAVSSAVNAGAGNTFAAGATTAIGAGAQRDFWIVVTNTTTPACTIYC